MKHSKQEKCGWVRGMYNPEQSGRYLISDINGITIARFDKEHGWMAGVKCLICWTFIPETQIKAPF
jgi:hypothetical protein